VFICMCCVRARAIYGPHHHPPPPNNIQVGRQHMGNLHDCRPHLPLMHHLQAKTITCKMGRMLHWWWFPSSICRFGLGDSDQMTWTFRGPVRPINFRKSEFPDAIAKAVKNKTSLHLVPSNRNFAAVDSILHDPGDPDAVLTCIQVATSDDHPIAVKGLQAIQGLLDSKNPLLEPLRPFETNGALYLLCHHPWHLPSNYKS